MYSQQFTFYSTMTSKGVTQWYVLKTYHHTKFQGPTLNTANFTPTSEEQLPCLYYLTQELKSKDYDIHSEFHKYQLKDF